MPKLTTIQRAQIIGLYDVPGQTPATIAQRFGVSKSTVTRLRQKYLQTNDIVDLPIGQEGPVSHVKGKIDLLHGQRIKIGFKQSASVYFYQRIIK